MRLENEKGWRVVRWQGGKGGRVVHRTLKTTEKCIRIKLVQKQSWTDRTEICLAIH